MTELEKLQAQKAELEKQIKELKRQAKVLEKQAEKQAIKKNYVGYEYKTLSGRTDDTLFHTIYLNSAHIRCVTRQNTRILAASYKVW